MEINKLKNIFTLIFIICANTILAISESNIDCSFLNKGCLLKRESNTVVIFFRGWVSPNDMSRYQGLRKRIDNSYLTKSARDILTRGDMIIGNANLTSSIFATGSSHIALSMEEMDLILEKANAKYLIFASHSGGYQGLRKTLLPASLSYWENLTSIWLLDNFYGGQTVANDLERNLGREFLNENCYGFVTDHNMATFNTSYKSLCPKIKTSGVTHSGGVLQCMPWFEQDQLCADTNY